MWNAEALPALHLSLNFVYIESSKRVHKFVSLSLTLSLSLSLADSLKISLLDFYDQLVAFTVAYFQCIVAR